MQLNVKDLIEKTTREVLKDITLKSEKVAFEEGKNIEKKIFKYIARKAINHLNPPRSIDGIHSIYWNETRWQPLSPATIKRKQGNRKKWFRTGLLKNYLLAQDPFNYYNNPKSKHDLRSMKITYISAFNSTRRPFPKEIENRITGRIQGLSDEEMSNEERRPLFHPMEMFIAEELAPKMIEEKILKFVEKYK